MSGIVVAPPQPMPRVIWRPILIGQLDPVDVARFVRRVDISGGLDACWPWTGPIPKNGYGVTAKDHGSVTAHRFALELKLGRPIAPGMFACHTCDNRPCCNPGHLYEGTPSDNMQDAIARGRVLGPRPMPQPASHQLARGERNAKAKVSEAEVREIRASSGLSNVALGRLYGLDDSTICRIRSGRYWSHVK